MVHFQTFSRHFQREEKESYGNRKSASVGRDSDKGFPEIHHTTGEVSKHLHALRHE
jgi:hypothetical protein